MQTDDPQFKAIAMQKLNLQTEAQWEATRSDLLQRLNASMANAQQHAVAAVSAGTPPSTKPYVPSDRFAAVFQSAMEEHLNDRLTSAALAQEAGTSPPYGPPEKYDSGDLGWSVVLLARTEELLKGKHPFVHSSDFTVFRYDMTDSAAVALFADWATGEAPALTIKAQIESQSPEYTIHLGDTYYAGFGDEISHNLVACWPGSVKYKRSFTLNGNHEMYSGGHAYFNILALFGHSASYFNLGNQHWRLIGLDTSWCERAGDEQASSYGELVNIEVDWLKAQVEHAQSFNPPARIILLTHHQFFSAFDGDILGKYLLPQVQPLLDNDGIYAWFWGHEHRGIVYDQNETYKFRARCIGHGGFPYPPDQGQPVHLQQFPILWREDRPEPGNAWYGMRGFAMLRFAGAQVKIDYIDQAGSVRHTEES